MKVAVTGASGFIGRYVLAELARRSIDTIAVTCDAARLGDGAKPARVVEMDIGQLSPDPFERLGRPDVLIHLAWDGLPHYKSLHHFEIELPRQYRFLKTLVEAGLPSLLATGTCFEYGIQSGSLTEDLPTQPSNPYGYAKDALRRQLESVPVFQNKMFATEAAALACPTGDVVLVQDMGSDDFFPDRPWGKGNNPKTAVWEFLKTHPEFEIDKSIEHKLLITVAPDGYLRRVK